MDSRISLVVPIISIVIIALVLLRPGITGFAVTRGNAMRAGISISTADGVILPVGSIVIISIDEETAGMPLADFITRSGKEYELVEGEVTEIGYSGPGFTGNHTYIVPMSEFNISSAIEPGKHTIAVGISYDGVLISASEREMVI